MDIVPPLRCVSDKGFVTKESLVGVLPQTTPNLTCGLVNVLGLKIRSVRFSTTYQCLYLYMKFHIPSSLLVKRGHGKTK